MTCASLLVRLWHLHSRPGPTSSEAPTGRCPVTKALKCVALARLNVVRARVQVPAPVLMCIGSRVVSAVRWVWLSALYVRRRLTGELEAGMTMKLVMVSAPLSSGFRGGVLTTDYLSVVGLLFRRVRAVTPVGSMLNGSGLFVRLVVVVYRSVSDRGLVLQIVILTLCWVSMVVRQT